MLIKNTLNATVTISDLLPSPLGPGLIMGPRSEIMIFDAAAKSSRELQQLLASGVVECIGRQEPAAAAGVTVSGCACPGQVLTATSKLSATWQDPDMALPQRVCQSFGDGSDGSILISTVPVILSRDMYYENLSISGTGSLVTNGYRVFVSGTLDLTSAPARAIVGGSAPGMAALGNVGGLVQSPAMPNTIGTNTPGSEGANGTVGAGAVGFPGSETSPGNGGASGASGAGGLGASGVGGAGSPSVAPALVLPIRRWSTDMLRGTQLIQGGCSGAGGGSGAGDGTNAGGGGGGGATGGTVLAIYARTIRYSRMTAASAICGDGGAGGAGGSVVAGNCGGGGGGAGAGGGWVYVAYERLCGETARAAISANGGVGGVGGSGFGTGLGGAGGSGGYGGRITLLQVTTSVGEEVDKTAVAGAPGIIPATGVGGAGGLGTLAVADLSECGNHDRFRHHEDYDHDDRDHHHDYDRDRDRRGDDGRGGDDRDGDGRGGDGDSDRGRGRGRGRDGDCDRGRDGRLY